IDELDNILETTTITGTKCSFYLNLPQTEGSYYLYAPSTGDKLQIKGSGNINFKLHTDLENDLEGILANATPANQRKASARKSTMSNLLTNGDFSQNAFSSSTSIGTWFAFDSDYTWNTENGSKVWRAKNKKISLIKQTINVSGGDSLIITADCYSTGFLHASINVFFINSTGFPTGLKGFGQSSGFSTSSMSMAIPSGTKYAIISLYGYNKTWFDNITAETKSAVIDADNDGVEDSQDEFPSDPTRAFTSSYPTAGTQKLAFEDLWPNQGDFDFNDMVIDSKVDYTLNADNELV